MNAPLEAAGLTRRYGDFVAVDAISLRVAPGEIVGFLGANGAGKTTTLRCLAGLLRPDRGEIRISGHDLAKQSRQAKAALGFVPDRPFLYERLTTREFLSFLGTLYRQEPHPAAARAEALIARLELDRVADLTIEALSFGSRQKVALIGALLHSPALLLLDEPLNGLDPPAARALKDLLREHATTGAGVLVSTHQLEVADRLCDRVVLLHHGRVLAEGAPAELIRARGSGTLEEYFLELTRTPPTA